MEQNPELREIPANTFPFNNVLQTAVQSEMLTSKEASVMSKKTATVSVRVMPFTKKEAEAILEKLGMPLSVVVDALYRQIILQGDIPFEMRNFDYGIKDEGDMSKEEFDSMMKEGFDQIEKGEVVDAKEFFEELREVCKS